MKPDPKKASLQVAKGRKRRDKASQTQYQINTQTHPDAGGIDIGAAEIVAAVPPDRCAEPVRTFTSFTTGLRELCCVICRSSLMKCASAWPGSTRRSPVRSP